MTGTRLPFEETAEYMSMVADMNFRIEAELREYIRQSRLNMLNPQAIRHAEQQCMERQTAISIEFNANVARLKEAYDEQ